MGKQALFDEARAEAFVGTVLGNVGGTMVTAVAAIGDRLGLFKDLAAAGPATASELAERNAINERYAREWLSLMAAAGYLDYSPSSGKFTLPAEHAPVLAEESGPVFFGGCLQMLPPAIAVLDELTDAFRTGGGVPQSAYSDAWWDGMERFTAGWFENHLIQEWIPAMPDVEAKLQSGALVADVGCGRGRALVKLATAYPKSKFVGYDVFGPSVDRATINAKEAGVEDRVRFEQRDGSKGLPETYDVIFTFDVVHDAVDPRGLLRTIRESLAADGVYVCLDINASHRLEENAGPLGSLFYGFSVLYCMTTSLANGGEGLGTCGFNEEVAKELGAEAGFSAVHRVPLENPFNNLYELRP
jgi:SAM-dependent methyltransferase